MGITAKRAISGPAIIAGLGGGNAVGTNAVAVGATLTNSLSTGNATNPNFVIRVGVKVASGAAQATATTALTIVGETLAATFAGAIAGPSLALGGATIGTNALAVTGTGSISGAFSITAAGASALALSSTANNAITFGGTSASFPAIGRNSGTNLAVTLADSSDYAPLQAAFYYAHINLAPVSGGSASTGFFATSSSMGTYFGTGAPTIAAGQGSLYLRNDGLPYYNTNGSTGWAQLASAASPTFTGTTAVVNFTSSGLVADTGYNYQTPSTGFTITMANGNYHLILDPAGTLATGTITMCAAPVDGQCVDIKISQIITALTVAGNSGQSVKGNPTSAAVGSSFTGIYRATNTTWYF